MQDQQKLLFVMVAMVAFMMMFTRGGGRQRHSMYSLTNNTPIMTMADQVRLNLQNHANTLKMAQQGYTTALQKWTTMKNAVQNMRKNGGQHQMRSFGYTQETIDRNMTTADRLRRDMETHAGALAAAKKNYASAMRKYQTVMDAVGQMEGAKANTLKLAAGTSLYDYIPLDVDELM